MGAVKGPRHTGLKGDCAVRIAACGPQKGKTAGLPKGTE